MGVIEVLSLGCGTRDVALSTGPNAATSFVILIDGNPSVLVGLGAGTLRSALHYLGAIPSTVIVLSGSLEQTAEVPLLIQSEVVGKGRQLRLFGASANAVDVANSLINLYYPRVGRDGAVVAANARIPAFTQLLGRDSGQFSPLFSSTFSAASSCPTPPALLASLQSPIANVHVDSALPDAQRAPMHLCGSIVVHFRGLPAVAFAGPQEHLSSETMLWLAQCPTVICWAAPHCLNDGGVPERPAMRRILRWFAAHHDSFDAYANGSGVGGGVAGDPNASTLLLGGMVPAHARGAFATVPLGGGGFGQQHSIGSVSPATMSGFASPVSEAVAFGSNTPYGPSSPTGAGSAMRGGALLPVHRPAHCVLAGWGGAADEPVPTVLPPYVTLAPQGTLLTVLMGDFVASDAPDVSYSLRSAAAIGGHPLGSRIGAGVGVGVGTAEGQRADAKERMRSQYMQQQQQQSVSVGGNTFDGAADDAHSQRSFTAVNSRRHDRGASSVVLSSAGVSPTDAAFVPIHRPQPFAVVSSSPLEAPLSVGTHSRQVDLSRQQVAGADEDTGPVARPQQRVPAPTSRDASPQREAAGQQAISHVTERFADPYASAVAEQQSHHNYQQQKQQQQVTRDVAAASVSISGAFRTPQTPSGGRGASAAAIAEHQFALEQQRQRQLYQQQQQAAAQAAAVAVAVRGGRGAAAYPPAPTVTTTGRTPRLHTAMASSSSSAAMHGSASAHPSGASASSSVRNGVVDTRKVYVFNNDNKGHEGRLFMLQKYRQLPKFAEAVAQQLAVMPLAALVFPDGRRVASLDEVPPDAQLLAVRRGGAPFDPRDLPRGMALRHQ